VPEARKALALDATQLQELQLADWISLGHDRKHFDCGVPALNDFLHHYALQQSKKGVSTVYVLVDRRQTAHILGFYSLSAAQVEAGRLSAAAQKKLPRYPIPCFRMGRLACSATQQGKGLGGILMGLAVERCLQARQQVAAYALLVDAKDEQAMRFYTHYGFTALQDAPLSLYLPLGAA
jgi:predicted GNAT family N-acyltransferase